MALTPLLNDVGKRADEFIMDNFDAENALKASANGLINIEIVFSIKMSILHTMLRNLERSHDLVQKT